MRALGQTPRLSQVKLGAKRKELLEVGESWGPFLGVALFGGFSLLVLWFGVSSKTQRVDQVPQALGGKRMGFSFGQPGGLKRE